mmetsp:Transcript_35964/g.73941  ORF Transcript_35964/g.73941 Transcript_35964/m.73941 type:complete len:223 (+) Transcript_35964:117-785(+)|eukprot:CAMPEP_0181306784 /NCGR_PEP_ID=MMETSP1101-20121128/10502_1 /TAXON_ID=46948 /ORGANISM="Rhodomonas abbreviata, Strain Caron Lab Isolate" /LENGTH=222 /DNA_ID=CAMNT_0023412899 /DNA_START=105 /DNA_END=773 /DNA_ORIENTATION=+
MKRALLSLVLISLCHKIASFSAVQPLNLNGRAVLRSANSMPLRAPKSASLLARPARSCALQMAVKESPLEGGGPRGLEEEERRIGMWTQKFELGDDKVAGLRAEFERVVADSQSELRTLNRDQLKRVIEKASSNVDMVDVNPGADGEQGRPAVTEDELNNYINALSEQWAEACEVDAVEVANGECIEPADLVNFDLPETLAVFGMCLTNHCGIGGVCFWDSE